MKKVVMGSSRVILFGLILLFGVVLTGQNVSSSASFNSTWNTSESGISNSTSISLPLESGGTYNFTVNWGDGNSSLITSWNQAEANYSYGVGNGGVKNISINGTIIGFRFNFGGDRLKLLDITNWGDLNLGNNGSYFRGANNLDITATDSPNLTGTTDMRNMFESATNLNSNLSNWNVSSVTNMSKMFEDANNFNGNLSNWDVSSVTDMSRMFYSAANFNQNLSNWDVSSVTDMNYMFYSAANFNGNISNWNVSSVADMQIMFSWATNFSQNLSNWDVSSVTDMNYMFDNADNFNGDLSNWNVSSVTNMRSMFNSATNFNGNLSNWDVSGVTSMREMFRSATNFNGNISNWNVSSVTDMYGMFWSTFNFNQSLSNWDVSSVTDMNRTFSYAVDFNGDISNWNVSSVTSMNNMFNDADAFNGNISNWDVSSVTDMEFMFSSMENFNQNLSNWDVSSVLDMGYMFDAAISFNGNLSNWDVSSVTNMHRMFFNAASFNQNLSNWDVSSVMLMGSMFYAAVSFNQNLGNWNVSSVTTMSSMFYIVTLSTTNYNSLLNGWAELSLQSDITFSGGNSKYSMAANTSRNGTLIGTYSWTITDGGLDTAVPVITLIAPVDSKSSTTSAYNFTFNVTDSQSIANCSLVLDGSISSTITTVNNSGGTNGIYKSSLSAATHTWSINCTNVIGNVANSSTRTLIVIAATTTDSGSGGGSGNYPIYRPNKEELKNGYQRIMYKNWKMLFKVENISHSFKVEDITETSVRISISSETQETTLLVGEEKKFEMSGDNYYDVFVKLNSIDATNKLYPKATFTITTINEEIISQQEEVKEEKGIIDKMGDIIDTGGKESLSRLWTLIIAIIIVLILAGAGYKKFRK